MNKTIPGYGLDIDGYPEPPSDPALDNECEGCS